MPFARLTVGGLTGVDASQLSKELTSLIASVLRKKQELTSVLIEMRGSGDIWTIGGEVQRVAAHLQVFVTAGTNTDDEKRAFIEQAQQLLCQKLSELAVATYVVVHELPGADWGYDGRTQADRAGDPTPRI